jgi:hypothetical protein
VPTPRIRERPARKRSSVQVETSPLAWALAMLRQKPTHGLATIWRIVFFAVVGSFAGTLLDAAHVWTGTAGYTNVAILPVLNVAWYVPLEFAAAGVTVGMLRPELDEELHRRRSDLPEWTILLGMVHLVVVWASSGLLGVAGLDNLSIAALLLVVAVINWISVDRSPQGVIAALIAAVVGVLVESAATRTGTYHYTRPDFLGVPMWLPSLYLTGCISVGNLGRHMKYSWDRPTGEPEDETTPDAEAA